MGLFIQGDTKITQNNGRVDGGTVPDRALDANSGNSIANDVVTAKFNEIVTLLNKKDNIARNTFTFTSGARSLNLTQLVGHNVSKVKNVIVRGTPVTNVHAYATFYIKDATPSSFTIMMLLPNATSFSGDVPMDIIYDME